VKSENSRRRVWLVAAVAAAALATALAACGSATSSAAGPKPLTTVTVTIPAVSIAFTPIYVGQYDGYYREAGLKVNTVIIPVQLEPQALVGSQVEFDGSLGFLMNAIAGHPDEFPVKVLAACGNSAPFVLVGGPGITKISQLRGKVIAGDAANSQPNLFVQAVLQQHGILPGQYGVDEVGAAAAGRWALVQAGKASAAMVDPNDPVLPPVKGHTVLANGSAYPSIGCGIAATTSFIGSHNAVVRAFVAATAKASHAAATNEAQAVAGMKNGLASLHLGYTQAQWERAWQLSKFIWSRNGLPTAASERAALTAAKQQDQLPALPKASLIFDLRYVPKGL
jgi:ABC-type nitrate/sulfonate/bicarbonate transport system substrate-binding protein